MPLGEAAGARRCVDNRRVKFRFPPWRLIMPANKMYGEIDHNRRRFFGAAAMTIAAAQFGMIGSTRAQTKPTELPAIKPGTNTSFGSLKQIDAGLLNVGYAEAGPADGPAVILLHGWPYDIHSFAEVTPLLASAGYHGCLMLSTEAPVGEGIETSESGGVSVLTEGAGSVTA